MLPEASGGFRRQIDAVFIAAQVATPANIIRCDSLLTTKALVRETDYVTILPREVAVAELSIGVLRAIPIAELNFVRQVGIRRLKERPGSPILDAFISVSRQAAQG